MVVAEGPAWRAQRQAASPAFRPARMNALAPIFVAAAEGAIGRWRRAEAIDLGQEMRRLTFEVILDAMLSGADHLDRSATSRRLARLFADMSKLRLSYFLAPDRYHAQRVDKQTGERIDLGADVQAMIAARRFGAARGDLLDLLLQARDPESGQGLSDDVLADNLIGFILAGHETTALTLCWALYLMAMHSSTWDRVREEARSVAGEGEIEPEHVGALVFTRQVIQETMRLYPQAFMLTRITQKECALAGRRVRAGQRINIPLYAIHRRAAVWADPHAFDPDRFGADRAAPDRFAFLPFGHGPRVCLGAAFAMAEMCVVVATVARACRLTMLAPERVWPVADLSLHPREAMWARVLK